MLAQSSVNNVSGPRFGPLQKNAHLGSMWHSTVNPADKVTASSLNVITAASGRAPIDVPQLSMNTAVFKLSRLAVELQKTSFALCVTISWTLAMRRVTRAKRKGMASVFLVFGLGSFMFIAAAAS